MPVMLVHDIDVATISLAGAFFSIELVVAPLWAVPMDIAPKYSGSSSGMMAVGFGLAGIISPFVFGYLIEAGPCRSLARSAFCCSVRAWRSGCALGRSTQP